MNTILIIFGLASLGVTTILLISRLSRRDERGVQLWRRLITPTPVDVFSSSDAEGTKKSLLNNEGKR